MNIELDKIGFGGGCHWCTEAVFQSLIGVVSVNQGYLASKGKSSSFSEGVVVTFNPVVIPLKVLIKIHLCTHKSAVNHSMRDVYRSAVYAYSNEQHQNAADILQKFKTHQNNQLVTCVLDIYEFKASREAITNYYFSNPKKPFCEAFIKPKLRLLLEHYSFLVDHKKLEHLKVD